jgi:hypothetical protein
MNKKVTMSDLFLLTYLIFGIPLFAAILLNL